MTKDNERLDILTITVMALITVCAFLLYLYWDPDAITYVIEFTNKLY